MDLGCKKMRLSQLDSVLTRAAAVLTSMAERCSMRLNLPLLVAVLLLSSSLFASPRGDRGDRDGRRRRSVPEPGSMVMLTLTAGTIVGGMFVRRRIQGSAVR